MQTNIRHISIEEIEYIKHPGETSRLILALLVLFPFAVLIVYAIYLFPLEILLYFLLYIIIVWIISSIAKAKLISNSVRVSERNFPEVYRIVQDVKIALNYQKNIDVFIVQDGTINSLMANFFATKFIILNSELVEDMLDDYKKFQIKWIIARFVGSLKAKQVRLHFFTAIFEGFESLIFINLFILPYIRSTQYSGDNIGLAVSGSLEQSMTVFEKILIGNELSRRVKLDGIVDQSKHMKNNFFVILARLFSPFPHTISRYLNLLAFAKWRYPEQFYALVEKLNQSNISPTDVGLMLPRTYIDKEIKENVYTPNNIQQNQIKNTIKITKR